VPKLKDHILPRIKEMLQKETTSRPDTHPQQSGIRPVGEREANSRDRDSVFFKNDRIYRHNLARFNYTTYDVRRAQDVINPSTSHRDILLLANNGEDNDDSDHPFLYARILGIFHTNVIYTGGEEPDYNARRVEFLWVRWFEYDGSRSVRWDECKLDSVHLPPMATEGAFGFVDPSNVLRSCHVIPAFAKGRVHLDGVGLSRIARDAEDWSCYYVNRCVTLLLYRLRVTY
jgi:hypothetical protein